MLKNLLVALLLCAALALADTAVPAKEFKWPTTRTRIKLVSDVVDCTWKEGRPYCQRADLVRSLGLDPQGDPSVDLIDALAEKGWLVRYDYSGDIQALKPSAAAPTGKAPEAASGNLPLPGGYGIPATYMSHIKPLMDARHTVDTPQAAGAVGKDVFREVPEGGALLTGFSVCSRDWMGYNIIYSVQPIFLSADGPLLGKRHGGKEPKVVTIQAKDGYAVGGLTVRAGMLVNGFSVTFMKVLDGRLDTKDSYVSEWVGDQKGGGEGRLAGDGALVVGIYGKDPDSKDKKDQRICSFGLVTIPLPNAPKKK